MDRDLILEKNLKSEPENQSETRAVLANSVIRVQTNQFKYHTFGCKVNTYDTGLMQKKINQYQGFLEMNSEKFSEVQNSIHVLNTCAVTEEATKQAVKLIRKLKAKDPFSTIVITGCAAQVDTSYFDTIPAVDLIVANSHKHELPSIMEKYFKRELTQKVFKANIFKKEDLGLGGGNEKEHTRSFLKIQDGCNSFCSYCIIPYARGTSRSVGAQALVDKINYLYEVDKINEVVLTGVHIGDYSDADLKLNLEGLVEFILRNTEIPRIRLSSLEPVEVSDKLLSLFSNPRLCPHFHMSIQSANTKVLKDMKRNYKQEDVINSLKRIKEFLPNAFIGMDVIVGFPTETEDDFLDTYRVLAEVSYNHWDRIHVFPYSERSGTKAAILDQLEMKVRKMRAERLRELSFQKLMESAQAQIGKKKLTLVMKNGATLSDDYWNIRVPEASDFLETWKGQLVSVKITGIVPNKIQQDVQLIGEVEI